MALKRKTFTLNHKQLELCTIVDANGEVSFKAKEMN